MKTVKTWVNKLLPDSYKSSLGDFIRDDIEAIQKDAYNSALDDCLKICESFRDYYQCINCINLIYSLRDLRKK